MEQKLHTPEGIRDIYNKECESKLTIQKLLNHVFHLYGYSDIQTPTFEYNDVFREEIGSTSTKDLYRFFDRDGNILALRPDITPSVARAVATVFKEEELPLRLCYSGNTFINHSNYRGQLRENTQLGTELIGADSVQADAEMLALVSSCLKQVGLNEFQISVGHVDFVQSLLEQTALTTNEKVHVLTLLSNRNYFGIEEFLLSHNVKSTICKAFQLLPELVGTSDIFKKALEVAPDVKSQNCIKRLEKIDRFMKLYGSDRNIIYDLSMNGTYGYYTGIIFRAYTFGTGDAIVRGGRYDHLLEKFGKNTPSIGFAIIIDKLMNALMRQKINIKQRERIRLYYLHERVEEAIMIANYFRHKNRCFEMVEVHTSISLNKLEEHAIQSRASAYVYLREHEQMNIGNFISGQRKFFDLKQS